MPPWSCLHIIVFRHVIHHLPVDRDIGRPRLARPKSSAAAPAVGDRQPAALHRVRDRRHAGVRHDVLPHERLAAGHRRLRLSAYGGALGYLHACAGHVRAVVFHRQSDQPLRRHQGDGLRRRIHAGRRRGGARAWPNGISGSRYHQRGRLEFPVRRRHHAGDDLLPPQRARQGPGAERSSDFGTTATSSFMAGFLQDRWGWQPLNWLSVLLMLAAAAAVLWLRNQRPLLHPAS